MTTHSATRWVCQYHVQCSADMSAKPGKCQQRRNNGLLTMDTTACYRCCVMALTWVARMMCLLVLLVLGCRVRQIEPQLNSYISVLHYPHCHFKASQCSQEALWASLLQIVQPVSTQLSVVYLFTFPAGSTRASEVLLGVSLRAQMCVCVY